MNEESGIIKYITDLALSVLDQVANGNGPKLMAYIFFGALGVVWLYCGLKIYLDARHRFNSSFPLQILFLFFGVITGPLGLVLYNLTKPKYTRDEMDFISIEHKFYFHQASKILDCLKCDSYVLEGQAHCTNCGTRNRFQCENCEYLSDYDDKYCSKCGNHLPDRMIGIRQERVEKKVSEVSSRRASEFIPAIQNLIIASTPKAKQAMSDMALGTRNLVNKVATNLPKREKQPIVSPVKPVRTKKANESKSKKK